MAATTNNVYAPIGERAIAWINYPMDASTLIPAGVMVCVSNATSGAGANGLLTNAAATAGFRFVGLSQQNLNNVGTNGGEISMQVQVPQAMACGCFTMNAASPTNAWVGQVAKVADNQTVALMGTSLGSTTSIAVGRIIEVINTNTAGLVTIDARDKGYLGALSGGTNGLTTGTAW